MPLYKAVDQLLQVLFCLVCFKPLKAVPFIAFQSSKEYFELPTEIINMSSNSRFKLIIKKSSDLSFVQPNFPLSYTKVSENADQIVIELKNEEVRKSNQNFIEFET